MVTGGGLGVRRGVHVLVAARLAVAAGIQPQALQGATLRWAKMNGNADI